MALIGGGFISTPSPVSGQKAIAVGKTAVDTDYILDVLKSNDSTVPSLKVEQTGSGDAAIEMKTADESWSVGVDNSDSDILKISNGSALTSSVLMAMDPSTNTTTFGGSVAISKAAGGDYQNLAFTGDAQAVNVSIFANATSRGRINLTDYTSGNAIQLTLMSGGNNRLIVYEDGEVQISGTSSLARPFEIARDTYDTWQFGIGANSIYLRDKNTANVALTVHGVSGNQYLELGQYNNISLARQSSVIIGYQAMHSVMTGDTDPERNVAIGRGALMNANDGADDKNVAIGFQTLGNLRGAGSNVAIGDQAMYGYQKALYDSDNSQGVNAFITGTSNVAIGQSSLLNAITASYNMALGYETLKDNRYSNSNVAIGYQALLDAGTESSGNNQQTFGNVAIGYQAGYQCQYGDANFFLGKQAGRYLGGADRTSDINLGSYNVAIGVFSMTHGHSTAPANNTGYQNVAIGYASMQGQGETNFTAQNSIAIGNTSMQHIQDAHRCTAIGTHSMIDMQSGDDNIAIGYVSGRYRTASDWNISIGNYALINGESDDKGNNTGEDNIAIGHYAMGHNYGDDVANFTGEKNVAIGTKALSENLTGSRNVSIGYESLVNMTASRSDYGTVAIGYQAGYQVRGGSNTGWNVFIGDKAGETWGYSGASQLGYNVFVGARAGRNGTSANSYGDNNCSGNVALGYSAMGTANSSAFTGGENTAIGKVALGDISSGSQNVALGAGAGALITSGSGNMCIGKSALGAITTQTGGTAIGNYALYRSGATSTGIGYFAGAYLGGGARNTIIGNEAMRGGYNTEDPNGDGSVGWADNDASDNVAVGYKSLGHSDNVGTSTAFTADKNVAVGSYSGTSLSTGEKNVFLGAYSGEEITTADGNTYIGAYSGDTTTTGHSNTAVGYYSLKGHSNTKGDGVPFKSTALGYEAGRNALNARGTVAVGWQTAYGNYSADYIHIGNSAGYNYGTLGDNTGSSNRGNISIGHGSLYGTTASNYMNCTAIGNYALNDLTTGNRNTALGSQAGRSTTTGADNFYCGTFAGQNHKTGNYNIAMGAYAFVNGTYHEATNYASATLSASDNIAFGYKSMGDNFATGSESAVNFTAEKNIGIGSSTLSKNLTGSNNIAIGYEALKTEDTGSDNIAIGKNSLKLQNYDGSGYNVCIGNSAGESATSTQFSFFLGQSAGKYVTTANNNIALGYETLGAGKGANRLRGYGDGGGMAAYSGERNIAIGYRALYSLSNYIASSDTLILGTSASSYNNTVIGAYAGTDMTTAKQNTLIGAGAGGNVLGNLNTMIGSGAGSNVFNASNVVAIGNAMGSYSGQTGCVAIGVGAFKNLRVSGGISTVDDTTPTPSDAWEPGQSHTNIPATSDDSVNGTGATFDIETDGSGNPTFTVNTAGYGYKSDDELTFTDPHAGTSNTAVVVVNATLSETDRQVAIGYNAGVDLTYGVGNTLVGDEAGQNITTGNYNTAVGPKSLSTNVTGGYNVAMGRRALYTSTASFNTGIGSDAGYKNTTGQYNFFLGYTAGYENTTSNDNVYIGYQAGRYKSTGASGAGRNIAIGSSAFRNGESDDADSNTGYENVILGWNAMSGNVGADAGHCTANQNVLIGTKAGYMNLSGDKNVGIGDEALDTLTTGNENTMVGYQAGDGITTGANNTGVGSDVAFDADADNQICIGYQATTTALNSVKIGNASIANANIQVDWTIDSDKRIKKDIENNTLGLDFINDLKPRKYKKLHPADWDKEIREKRYEDGVRDEFDDEKVWDGLIAQEVKETIEKSGTSFSGWSEDANGKQGIQYSALVVPLIKAVQELSKEVNELKRRLK
tara:strand:- start:531 stop:5999 length:5469 start_codon:yes stop_codon:yes gene_type:complete